MSSKTACIMVTVTLTASCAGIISAGELSWRSKPLVLKAAQTSPGIDGNLDDACWQEADWRPLQFISGGKPGVGGMVAFSYDKDKLYAALRLDEPDPGKIKAPRVEVNSPKMWHGEVVEWFINRKWDGHAYVQLAWNPAGSRFNARCDAPNGPGSVKSDVSWRPQWNTASVIGKRGWTTEAAISFAELGTAMPKDGVFWTMNLCRTRNIGKREFSLLAVTGGGFHNPDRFLDVWFGRVAESGVGAGQRTGPVKTLVGCWSANQGYDGFVGARYQLDRALGQKNVEIRVFRLLDGGVGPLRDWPRRYRDLAKYHLVVLANIPRACLSPTQLEDLCRYVYEGGKVILVGRMAGWKHSRQNTWMKSVFGAFMPLDPQADKRVEYGARPIDFTPAGAGLFKGIPLHRAGLTFNGWRLRPNTGSVVLAAAAGTDTAAAAWPFMAEKRTGKGSVIQVMCNFSAGGVRLRELGGNIFRSPYAARFWDNLLQHATGRVPVNAAAAVATAVAPAEAPPVRIDLVDDNNGNLFCPGARLRLRLRVRPKDYPYAVSVTLAGANQEQVRLGSAILTSAGRELGFMLPDLDRGDYRVRVAVSRDGKRVGVADDALHVVLPLMQPDEFGFKVVMDPGMKSPRDSERIARNLKAIGFTGVTWLGGILCRGYQGRLRLRQEYRFASIMQRHGLRVTPCWYPLLYEVLYSQHRHEYTQPGKPDRLVGALMPDALHPAKAMLSWQHAWLELFAERMFGRMPLTDGFAVADEPAALVLPPDKRFRDGFAALVKGRIEPGSKAYTYASLNHHLKTATDLTWQARRICAAYAPRWAFGSVITPNSLAGHASSLIDVPGTATALGLAQPDIYHYGEPRLYQKSLHAMAMIWSATEFGKLSKPGFMGGQLACNYYEDFPEQVFAAISGGAREFSVFAFSCTSFEKHGRQDPRFAAIARKTTAAAGYIGRALNHYERQRARVAMLYPHTAHLHLSMGKEFNDDYLKMIGTSKHYLGLRYAMEAAFGVLREMVGHVDVLYDHQVQRGDLKDYDVLVLTACKQVEERTLRELGRFVRQGGTLLVTSDSGRRNEGDRVTDTLYRLLPATVGKERIVPTDYSQTRLVDRAAWSRGNALEPGEGAEVLFTFPDKAVACVRGAVGRGQAILLGMPLAGLKPKSAAAKYRLIEYLLRKQSWLVSRADDHEFSAITFKPKRGMGRAFMICNHRKVAAASKIVAWADPEQADWTLADMYTGERISFAIQEGVMTFTVKAPALWGRALAFMPLPPVAIELSVSGNPGPGSRHMLCVRMLGRDGRPLHSTLPFTLEIRDPDGRLRDDLSGVRVADQGVWAYAWTWPVNAKQGTWTASVKDAISGSTDKVSWIVQR